MLVLAHRGASAYAPENTEPAFRKAIELGADGVELDVHLCKDGHMVVNHNFDVDHNSDGLGLIEEYTLRELKQLDFGLWKGVEFKGTSILTLEEALEIVKNMKLINIEIKSAQTPYPSSRTSVRQAYFQPRPVCPSARSPGDPSPQRPSLQKSGPHRQGIGNPG